MGDVLVIGGGLAGTLTALLLKQGGAQVALARAGWGATATYAGAFELATSGAAAALGAAVPHADGAPSGLLADWPLRRHVEDLAAHEPLHPFAVLGPQAAYDHLVLGYRALAQALVPVGHALPELDGAAPQRLMPHAVGCLTQTPASLGEGAHTGPFEGEGVRRWGVLHLPAWGAPLGPRVRAGWAHDAAAWGLTAPEWVALRGPSEPLPGAGAMAAARHLDDLGHAQALVDLLRPQMAGLQGLIVPPVLGLKHHGAVRSLLERALGVPVIEALAGIPSVPGLRLMMALEAALVQQQIRVVSAVQSVQVTARSFTSAQTQAHGTVHARAAVLATGRFTTGGLQWRQGLACTESLFGLPVLTAAGPLTERGALEVTRRRPHEDHPVMTAGVGTDENLRPLDASGRSLKNVYAAGLVVGGYNPTQGRCADGVALATAHHIATHLLAHAQQGEVPA